MESGGRLAVELGVVLVMGFWHGLGPDHVMALTTLVSRRPGQARVGLLGLAFGLGHMGILCALGVLAAALGYAIPEGLERGAEAFGGVLLMALGLWVLVGGGRDPAFAHAHAHAHGHGHGHPHVHTQSEAAHAEAAHAHAATPAIIGALFALSGVRHLIAVPVIAVYAQRRDLVGVALLLCAFGAGIVASMWLAGVLMNRVFATAARSRAVFRAVTVVTGLAAVGLGGWWALSA